MKYPVRWAVACPTTEESSYKALWSMFMLTADDSAIYFCVTEAVSTVSSLNTCPEIAQHADSVRLLSFELAKSR